MREVPVNPINKPTIAKTAITVTSRDNCRLSKALSSEGRLRRGDNCCRPGIRSVRRICWEWLRQLLTHEEANAEGKPCCAAGNGPYSGTDYRED